VGINEQIKIEEWEEYFRAMLNGSEKREERTGKEKRKRGRGEWREERRRY